MMHTLYKLEGSRFRIEVLQTEKVQQFIGRHSEILDSGFQQVKMSDAMRRSLQHSNYIFSGIKTFHELNEAFPSLINPDGSRKPFEQFLNDVRKIDKTYNQHYLRAEYNLAQQSANMAAKWEQFLEDGDRYNLQYRTANDGRVRPEHAALNRVTLPITDSFWQTYYPPNGWNCRCTVVQVRKGKYPETPHEDAMQRGAAATGNDKRGIFHFNPGKEQKTFPDYNPYTIRRCRDCDLAKGTAPDGSPVGKKLAKFIPENELCAACRLLKECAADRTKSQNAIERKHYLHEMEPLLKVKHTIATKASGPNINVGFTKIGNEHLYSDTFGRSKVLKKEDLKALDHLLTQATYIDEKDAYGHKYNIERFYYYEAELRGHKIRLNVAKEVKRMTSGWIRIRYYLYSINDIKRISTEGDS